MSANVEINIDKIGTKLVEPIEKGSDKEAVSGEDSSVSSSLPCVGPSRRQNATDNSIPKNASSPQPVNDLTTGGKQIPSFVAPEENNSPNVDEISSVQNEILNKLPNGDNDQCSNDSLIFKIADSVSSTAGASADTESESLESHLTAKKNSVDHNSDESDCSSISAESSLSAISIYDTSSDSCLDVARVKRSSENETDSVNIKKFKVGSSSQEVKENSPVSKSRPCATEKERLKLPKSIEGSELSTAKTDNLRSSGELENPISNVQNCSSLFEIDEIATETEVPPPENLSMLNNFEFCDSNNSFPETLLEGVHVPSPVFCTDPVEDNTSLNVPSEDSSSSKMKGEVVAAPMPIPETRSPMIHIPASIVSEFMNSESSLSPVIAKSAKKNACPLNTFIDEFAKSSNDSSGGNTVINGSSKPVGVVEKSPEEAVEGNTKLKNGEESSSAPLIGSTPPDSRPAKPASPAALSNPPLSVSSPLSDSTDKMDISNDLDSSEKPVTYQLTNGTYENATLCTPSDPLGDISSFGNSSVSDDPMSRTLLTPLTGTVATPVLLADDELPQSTDITELAPVRTAYVSNSFSTASTSTNLDNTSTTKLLDVRNSVSPDAVGVGEPNKNLKRSLPAEEDQNNKKLRLSPDPENTSTSTGIQAIEDDASKALVEAEVEKLKHTASKLRKLKRKDLENIIIELFMNKVLHNHELGKYKTLCEKLESTLESNRKKAAQFHKELDDLRKVTRKLQEEHQNRKDHLVTPIKIKRSVGIQAAPHIIQKGIAAACGEPGRAQGRSLQTQNNGVSSQQSMVVIGNSSVGTSGPLLSGSPQNSIMRTSFGGGRMGTVSQGDRRGSSQPLTSQMNLANKSNAVIDLTDEEESRTSSAVTSVAPQLSKTPQNVVKVTAASGFVSLPTTSGAAQYVLVPSSAAGAGNTVMVAATNVATNSLAGSSNSTARLLLPSVPSVMTSKTTSTLLAPPPPVMPQQQPSPHPAPLPRTAPQQVVGGAKQLPPQPTLKLSHKDNSIVLSWTMAKTSEHEAIASYQLFAYQESNQPPSPSLWKKVGSVKALELPMACTLTQFMPGHRYHFAVRAVDAKSRLGPFSDPRSIRLEK